MIDIAPLLAQASDAEQTVKEALGILQNIMEYAGTIAFAISGALAAGRKKMDYVGVVILGSIVAVGGGTTRDLIIGDVPVFWINDPTFMIIGALTALATIPLTKTGTLDQLRRLRVIKISDAAGMALFVVTGTNVALAAGAGSLAAAIVGVISGVGGGIIRDVLANETPDVLVGGQFYASAAFVGALSYILLLQLPISRLLIFWIPIALIFGIRTASLHYGWGIPTFEVGEDGRRLSS
jgi:uncharacterized membrane protein YeiH